MRPKFLVLVFILLSLIIPSLSTSAAQINDDPIVLAMDGDYWRYFPSTGLSEQITTWGHNREPVISPDNAQIAYSSTATIAVEAIERVGGIGGGDLPSNIWVLEIDSGDGYRVADQPPDASLMVEGVPEKFILRSTPAWSPDGTSLAWAELLRPEDTTRLAIYTFSTGTTSFSDIPVSGMYGIPAAPFVKWGDSGIAVENFYLDEAFGSFAPEYFAFDDNGLFKDRLTLPPFTNNVFHIGYELVDFAGDEFIGVFKSDGSWLLLDPDGVHPLQSYTGPMELYNTANSTDYVVRVLLAQGSYQAIIVSPTQTYQVSGSANTLNDFSISPSGDSVAYTQISTRTPYYLSATNTPIEILVGDHTVSQVLWGYNEIRIPGSGQPETPGQVNSYTAPTACEGFMPSRLVIGQNAFVIPGLGANRIRIAADGESTETGTIPENGIFEILSGPVCAQGTAWWEVDYNGTTGWTAEGDTTTYWLRPGTPATIAPSTTGAVLEITAFGAPLIAYSAVSKASEELDTLLWGDRILWRGNRTNNQTLPWLEVTLGDGSTAYVIDTPGALQIQNPGYQTPGITTDATVRVTASGDRMNLRSNSSTGASRAEVLLEGQTMQVIGGPVYNEYYVWWQFQLPDGTTGWAVDVPGWLSVQ